MVELLFRMICSAIAIVTLLPQSAAAHPKIQEQHGATAYLIATGLAVVIVAMIWKTRHLR